MVSDPRGMSFACSNRRIACQIIYRPRARDDTDRRIRDLIHDKSRLLNGTRKAAMV